MAGHLLGVLESSVVFQVGRDASCPPGVTSDGGQKTRRLGPLPNRSPGVFGDFGAGSRDKLRNPRLRRSASDDRKYVLHCRAEKRLFFVTLAVRQKPLCHNVRCDFPILRLESCNRVPLGPATFRGLQVSAIGFATVEATPLHDFDPQRMPNLTSSSAFSRQF
jgi:hypothetical protein